MELLPPGAKTFALSALLPSQKTLRRPDLSATKAPLPFSETPLAISPNRNAAFVADY
jgi:hypothetical protein